MALTWSGRRQALYTGFAAIITVVALFFVWQFFFTSPVSCHNGKQDGTELGVDCGGSCALICAQQAHLPVVLWQRSFESSEHIYTAAAFIENRNVGAGAKGVPYVFQLYEGNNLVAERDGVADLPPMQTIPIVETNIDIGNRQVTHTEFCFTFSPHCSPTPSAPPQWYKIPPNSLPEISISSGQANADYTRLSTTLSNLGLSNAKNLSVVAVLFDAAGVARAASKSTLESLPGKSRQQVVFTWAGEFAPPAGEIVKSQIIAIPSI